MAEHRLDNFNCGKPPLNDWLRKRALGNEGRASRTYVVVAENGPDAGRVVAYYSLASGAASLVDVPRPYRHNLPDPVGVMLLGRLAVDRGHAGRGLGPAMLREVWRRTLQVAGIAGVRALIVHAIDDDAVGYYERFGFKHFPAGTRTLFIATETIAKLL